MTNYYYEDFTYDNYRRMFEIAKKSYRFAGYDEYDKKGNQILLRHDVDFSLTGAERLAEIENALGIKSTYFVFSHCDGYNLYEKEMYKIVKHIMTLGHDIGLHVDLAFYSAIEGRTEEIALEEINMIEKVFGCKVKAISFHNPTISGAENLTSETFANVVNAYSEKIFSEYKYCSDSNGYWRYERLEDVLLSETYSKLQILLHPVWWCEKATPPAKRLHDYYIFDAERKYKAACEFVHKANRRMIGEEDIV